MTAFPCKVTVRAYIKAGKKKLRGQWTEVHAHGVKGTVKKKTVR